MNFIVLDTEGNPNLTEIAIINNNGDKIYEKFINDNNREKTLNELFHILKNIPIVCHYAKHDKDILQRAFNLYNINVSKFKYICTFELSKKYFKEFKKYSLEYLSSKLNIKIDGKYFYENMAHRASYDAIFTYHLYQKLLEKQMQEDYHKIENPFSSSRVDTPFQKHFDLEDIYKDEFDNLISIIESIKNDQNRQSKTVSIIANAGSGKTHLIMRLANKVLDSNRLFFIRQPNNSNTVLYHIYSRMLESFVQLIPNSKYSQLEYLLAKSFSQIIIDVITKKSKKTKGDEAILNILKDNHLNIYERFGKEGTKSKNNIWSFIERLTLRWWGENHTMGGLSSDIIRGLIKFCSYSDQNRRDMVQKWLSGNELLEEESLKIDLPNWNDKLNKEDFALEAMSTFGKLSIVDQPLILVFDQLEGLKNHQDLLLSFGEAYKEIVTHIPNSLIILNLFPSRYNYFIEFFDASISDRFSNTITLNTPSSIELKNMLITLSSSKNIDINQIFKNEDFAEILKLDSIRKVINTAFDYYNLRVHNHKLPQHIDSFEDSVLHRIEMLEETIRTLQQKLNMNINMLDNKVHKIDINSYFTNIYKQLEKDYSKPMIISDSEDKGKLQFILEAVSTFKDIKIDFIKMRKTLPEHIEIKIENLDYVVGFLYSNGNSFVSRIKNFNEMILYHKNQHFRLFRDYRESKITGKKSKEEIAKLDNTNNGKFIIMDKEDKIIYDLIYQFVSDISNKETDIKLKDGFNYIYKEYSDY